MENAGRTETLANRGFTQAEIKQYEENPADHQEIGPCYRDLKKMGIPHEDAVNYLVANNARKVR